MKKLLLIFALCLPLIFSITVFAEETYICLRINDLQMQVNGFFTEIDPGRSTTPVIRDGRTLVPIRAIIEAFGGTVSWDENTRSVGLTLGEDRILLVLDHQTAYLNDLPVTLDVAPTIIDDRTMLPLRFVAEGFGLFITWDPTYYAITVTNIPEVVIPLPPAWETDIRWSYANGVLTIDGSGDMANFKYTPEIPWYGYSDTATQLVITEGVTSIGNYAFSAFSKLTSVSLPQSVTRIGAAAFLKCPRLLSITLPENIHEIGDGAFSYCTTLSSIEISEANPHFKIVDGHLFTKDGATLLQYAIGKPDSVYTIPEGVVTIAERAFYGCDILTDVVFPASVKTIEANAFNGCDKLSHIVFGIGTSSIATNAFYSCDGLTAITIPRSLTTVDASAFANCNKLTDAYFVGSSQEWMQLPYSNNATFGSLKLHYNHQASATN